MNVLSRLKFPVLSKGLMALTVGVAAALPLSADEVLIYSENFNNPTGDDLPLAAFNWQVAGEPTNFPIADGEITMVWNAISKADNFDPDFDPNATPGSIFTLESEAAVDVSRLLFTEEVTIARPANELSRIVFWTSTFNISVNYDMHIAVRVGDAWYASNEEVGSAGWVDNDDWYDIDYDVAQSAGWMLLATNANGGFDVTTTELATLPAGDITAVGVLGFRDGQQWNPNMQRWGGFRIDNFEVYSRAGSTSPSTPIWDDIAADAEGWKDTEIGMLWDAAYPQVYSVEHGWLYAADGDRTTGYYFYSFAEAQWMWTNVACSGWVYGLTAGQFQAP